MARPFLRPLFRWLDTRTCRRAAAIVVLSRDMEATIRARPGGADMPIHVINNFAQDTFDTTGEAPPELAKPDGTVRIIFAGNMGRFQNVPLLADGVGQVLERYPQVQLLLLGDGVALPELKAKWEGHPQVRFHPFLPFADAQEVIRGADLGLVCLAAGIYQVSYPSKVLTYLALGLPMLAVVEPHCQLAAELREQGLGAVPEAATPEAIAQALDGLLSDPTRLDEARDAVHRYHEAETSIPAAQARWCALMDQLASQG